MKALRLIGGVAWAIIELLLLRMVMIRIFYILVLLGWLRQLMVIALKPMDIPLDVWCPPSAVLA